MGKRYSDRVMTVDHSGRDVVERLAQRNPGALDDFLSQYRSFLLYHCRRLFGGNREDAEDLFSQVVMHVYTEDPQALRNIHHLGGWLRQVVHNKFIDMQRSRLAMSQKHQFFAAEQSRHRGPCTPEKWALGEELLLQISLAFRRLPDRLRDAAVFRLVDEMSYESISIRLNISKENARKRVQEARLLLMEALSPYVSISVVSPDQLFDPAGFADCHWSVSRADSSMACDGAE